LSDGTLVHRNKGTPQGGVISPVLSNLFLHYVFDAWMTRNYPQAPWCRYADDGLVHCRTEGEAKQILAALHKRFEACHLELHSTKTKIVYCKDGRRRNTYEATKFVFLGYEFRRRTVRNTQDGSIYLGFTPAVSPEALKSIYAEMKQWKSHRKASQSLAILANWLNPIIRGWMNYYGHYSASWMRPVWMHMNRRLSKWAQRRYRKLYGRTTRVRKFLEDIATREPDLFVHWRATGMTKGFV
jgi:hypothetical protein